MHDLSILSTPSDMILDRVRRREMVSGVFIIETMNQGRLCVQAADIHSSE